MSFFAETAKYCRDDQAENKFKNKIDPYKYNDKKAGIISAFLYKIKTGRAVQDTDYICLENIVHLGFAARDPFRVIQVEKVIGKQVARDQQEEHLHVFFQRAIETERLFDDPVADQEADFLIEAQFVSDHKRKYKYKYINDKTDDI